MPGPQEIAATLVMDDKGILAADESIGTMSKRLEGVGVTASEDARRDYRELLLTTPDLSHWVSGIILSDETLRQTLADGTPFPEAAAARGVQAGIKVDKGVTRLPFAGDNKVTDGLDGLGARMEEYGKLGATFAKWRAVIAPVGIDRRSLLANAHALARYAAHCQDAGIVPIVEPEVLMDGEHGAAVCERVTGDALEAVFDQLDRMGVDPAGMILKPNKVIAGAGSHERTEPDEVAERTLEVLRANVAEAVPGICFLSGGQSNERACANLQAINRAGGGAPWRLTFSFGRALVNDALSTWSGHPEEVGNAQAALASNCGRASAASHPSDRAAEVIDV